MDVFVTCACIITIIVNPYLNGIFSKLCGYLNKVISTLPKSPVSTAVLAKDCKVVLEDISSSCDAVKLKTLDKSQENTQTTNISLMKRLLENCSKKTQIATGKANDDRWPQLDDIVPSKLKKYKSLTERQDVLQNTIDNEAANIFGHSEPPKWNLVGQSMRTKSSIQLIKENFFLNCSNKYYF